MDLENLKRVGVIGSGTMGSEIAQVVASNGREVGLVDISDSALDRGMKATGNSLRRIVKKGEISEEDCRSIFSRIKTTTNLENLSNVDLVIEATFEDTNVKKEIVKKLDALTRPDVIISTNTSSLPIVDIAVNTKRQDKVVGMYFFKPFPVMKLVEVVKNLAKSDETVE